MLIAECKGRIETIETRFGFDHGEDLQQVKYQMSISHSVFVQSLFTGLFYFLQKHTIAIYSLLLLHWFPIDQLAPPCSAPDITSIVLKQELLQILIMM